MRELYRQLAAQDGIALGQLEGEHLRAAGGLDEMDRPDLEIPRIQIQFTRIRVDLLDRELGSAFEPVFGEVGPEVERDVPDEEPVGLRVGMGIDDSRGSASDRGRHQQPGEALFHGASVAGRLP
jgi:hypothetical protein